MKLSHEEIAMTSLGVLRLKQVEVRAQGLMLDGLMVSLELGSEADLTVMDEVLRDALLRAVAAAADYDHVLGVAIKQLDLARSQI